MDAKRDYILKNCGFKSEFMPLFSEAENILDSRDSMYAMSRYSTRYLSSLDLKKFSATRRENYLALSSRLKKHKEITVIFPELSAGVIPFLLPVYAPANRSDFQKFMAKHNVFPTIIWKCPEELIDSLDPKTRKIYDSIICFHIDQRYDKSDMEKVADIVDAYFQQNNG